MSMDDVEGYYELTAVLQFIAMKGNKLSIKAIVVALGQ
jgi:hypothetical protein